MKAMSAHRCLRYEMYAAKIRAAENRSPNIKPTIPPKTPKMKVCM